MYVVAVVHVSWHGKYAQLVLVTSTSNTLLLYVFLAIMCGSYLAPFEVLFPR